MKIYLCMLLFLSGFQSLFAQSTPLYDSLIKVADTHLQQKKYKQAALTYSAAFKTLGWKGAVEDRYKAARTWALAGVPDSAFFNLERIATRVHFAGYDTTSTDTALRSLHRDRRWRPLLNRIKENKATAEAVRPLARQLEAILKDDQKYRIMMDSVEKKHGFDSEEMKALWKKMDQQDSINLKKVTTILDEHGWLGPGVVGEDGNATLFLVIQHADLTTQEKYLPLMRQAVQQGKAHPADLALLEDRVALGQGRKQIYGSQLGRDEKTGQYYVQPLEDPEHVDERRSAVGLNPLAEYVLQWGIKWDVEAYKRQEEAQTKQPPKN